MINLNLKFDDLDHIKALINDLYTVKVWFEDFIETEALIAEKEIEKIDKIEKQLTSHRDQIEEYEKEIKTIRQLASNIKKYGKKLNNQYEYMIDDIHLLGNPAEVTMYSSERPIMLDPGIVTADWFDGPLILNRGSVYKIINIIKEHNELKLLEGIE